MAGAGLRAYLSQPGWGWDRKKTERDYRRYKAKQPVIRKGQRGYLRKGGYYGRRLRSGQELKFHDLVESNLTIPTTGARLGTNLCIIPQGTGASDRIGRKIWIKKIQMNISMHYIPTTAAEPAFYRMLLVMDKQANGANATWANVMESTVSTDSFRNLENSQRFKILKDWRGVINQVGREFSTNYLDVARKFSYYADCNIPIEYSSTTGVIAEQRSNTLFVIACMSNAPTESIEVSWYIRLRFTDGA